MEEIVKHINDTNASYRALGAGDAKNTDLFLDNEHYELFKESGNQITVRFNKENLTKAILFIASILPRKYDNSSEHKIIPFSSSFVLEQLAFLDGMFMENDKPVETHTQVWTSRKDVIKKNGDVDNRFYFNGLFEDVKYNSFTGEPKTAKFTIRNYLAGGYSDLHIRKNTDGIFDVWVSNVLEPYNDGKDKNHEIYDLINNNPLNNNPLQQIYYGAPGTGKSFEINLLTKDKEVIRTTFHPDSDYSTFVGAYKPTSIEIPVRDVTGKVIVENGKQVTENRIVYEFVEQAFLQAYTNAWKAYAETAAGENAKEQYLIIEEINRGNCAQIFGDLFQLLDRNRYGFSDYPITADKDMKKQLAKAFKDLTIADANRINKMYGKDIVSQVLNGEVLLLPDNLYIWATMNTSDQSLFPIDSAFKRRWDWKYMPICEGKDNGVSLNWKIKTKTNTYDWWQFVEKINAEINEQTKSEDKKLGYFFCKADNGEITAETFVSKVVFYLWNDVFKDQSFASDIFQDGEEELTFTKFYDVDANGMAVVREDKVELFLQNLGVEIVTSNNEDGLIEIDDLDENNAPGNTRNALKAIEFPDGTIIESTSGAFDAYIRAIEKIGIEKVASVSDRLKYRRHDRPLISKEKYDEFEGTGYSYIMKGDYYFLKGAKTYTYVRILEDLNELLQLGITIRN